LKKKNIKKYCCQQKQHLPVPAKAVTVIVAGRSLLLQKNRRKIDFKNCKIFSGKSSLSGI
jgi:hypothetical protein